MNRTSQVNLLAAKTLPISRYADRSRKFLDSVHFNDFLRMLLPVEMDRIARENGFSPRMFRSRYLISEEGGDGIAIFLATYVPTQPAVPPDDGKLRELKPDLSWQTVAGQHILPKSEAWRFPPIPYNVIYA